MSSSPSNVSQSTPAFFALKTGKGQYVVKAPSSDDFELSAERNAAILFEMPGAPQTSDGQVLLRTLGGRTQVPADPSLGVVLRDGSAAQAPFLKVPVADGFALGTPDKEHWLSVSDGGKLVFSKLNSPGASEIFSAEPPPHHSVHGCCGPALYPSTTLWDDVGHRTIIEQAVKCLRNPWSPTTESQEFIRIWNSSTDFQTDLFKGLLRADYDSYYNDTWAGLPYYTSHFYDPETGRNYWGDDSPNALKRGSQLFKNSVDLHTRPVPSDTSSAELLGLALHYFTDLTQPMHAANIANIYGDHPDWPLADWRHSNFEDYSELIAKSGKLYENYPRLTVEEMSIDGIGKIEDLYHSIAMSSKRVWRNDVKPIYDQKRYLEAWGPEAAEALKQATYMAPVSVAKFLSFWTRAIKTGTM